MAKKVKRKKGKEREKDVRVELAPTVGLLHKIVTEPLCKEVFQCVRTTERQRKWTLYALARFWLAVILDPPAALTHVLERVRGSDPTGFLPCVDASSEAFFERCRDLSSNFFATLYFHFMELAHPQAPLGYTNRLRHLRKRFSDVLIIDGSRLDKVAHRLKILWNEQAAVLPGCILALYDIYRGIASQLWFSDDAAESEFSRGLLALEGLRRGTLLLGDRLYCSPQIFEGLRTRGCYGLFRRNKAVHIERIKKLSSRQVEGARIEDYLVWAGAERIQLRLIRLERGGKTYEALTSDLDPNHLSADEVVQLYPVRWKVERLFFELKDVLNLHRFYCANPNAVAMQVFGAAMVHTAFRIAQADVAKKVKLPPEELSPKKLFPRLALASIILIEAEYLFERTCLENPGVRLRKPDWSDHPKTVTVLGNILVQRRKGDRRSRPFSEARRRWKSFSHIEGRQ